MRTRKPCFLARLRRFGWYVLFIVSALPASVETTPIRPARMSEIQTSTALLCAVRWPAIGAAANRASPASVRRCRRPAGAL